MTKADVARFWAKVDKRGDGECWLWTARCNGARRDRPVFYLRGKYLKGYRVSWAIARKRPIPPSRKLVLHTCDTPKCVNPRHLRLGTQFDNMRDCAAKGRVRFVRAPGDKNGRAVLSWADVRSIRQRVKQGESFLDLAASHGTSTANIRHIVNGVTWREAA